jgi:hypothetical protein
MCDLDVRAAHSHGAPRSMSLGIRSMTIPGGVSQLRRSRRPAVGWRLESERKVDELCSDRAPRVRRGRLPRSSEGSTALGSAALTGAGGCPGECGGECARPWNRRMRGGAATRTMLRGRSGQSRCSRPEHTVSVLRHPSFLVHKKDGRAEGFWGVRREPRSASSAQTRAS